jgi:hypothetical protein
MSSERRANDGDFSGPRERIYGHASSSRDGRQVLLAALFAIGVFLLLLALSVRQATAPAPAENVISAGVAATTDLDQLLLEEREPLRQLAQTSNASAIALPGYPLDVYLTHDEALNATTSQLRAVILQRSSAFVYTNGLSAFDRTGKQSISRFSSEGLVDLAVGQLSDETHSRAALGTLLFALLTATAACGVLVTNSGWGRIRTLGIGTLIGALPGLIVFVLGWLLVGRLGGSDGYTSDLREIARTAIMVPLRNFAIAAAAGAAVTAGAVVMSRLDARQLAKADATDLEEDHFEGHAVGTGD